MQEKLLGLLASQNKVSTININMALGSSCITSGTESDEEENDNKKPRLDDSKEASNQSLDLVESDRQDVTDIPSVAGVTRTVLRATRKEDKGRSSGVAGAITSEKSSKGEAQE